MDSDSSASTMKTFGIEHRLYGIGEKIILCTPQYATMYALKGYTIFDFHESLDMKPEYYSEEIELDL